MKGLKVDLLYNNIADELVENVMNEEFSDEVLSNVEALLAQVDVSEMYYILTYY